MNDCVEVLNIFSNGRQNIYGRKNIKSSCLRLLFVNKARRGLIKEVHWQGSLLSHSPTLQSITLDDSSINVAL